MSIYDLYGSKVHSLDEVRVILEDTLQVRFGARDSDYMGGKYFLAGDLTGETFVILRNHDSNDEGEVLEPEFANYPTLLQVNATERGDDIKQRLDNISDLELLRRIVN
jgi:hypothetical protein